MQEEKISFLSKTRRFFKELWRVLKITRKPTKDEFKTIVKASGLGIIVIGFIGFVIQMLKYLIK